MNFPSFGDATTYDQLGRSCAAAIAGPGSVLDGCYHPLRPAGSALLMATPYLVTDDPVDAAYVAVALNVLFLAVAVTALAATLLGDRLLLPETPRRVAWLTAAAFAVLLVNLAGHIPVRLGDLPALALFVCALPVAMGVLGGAAPARSPFRRYAACGALVALAVLVKVTYLAYGLVLLGSLLVLDPHARGSRARRTAFFLLGAAPIAVQVANVYVHTGQLGLYDREFMRVHFSYPRREYGIESVVFTIPEPTVYLTQVEGGISRLNVLVLRLYRGIFGFEWAVYLGQASRPPLWRLGTAELARAWALVLGYFGISAWSAWRAAPSLRLLNSNAAGAALATAVLMHTELRYYALPRAVLWLTLALAALAAVNSRARRSATAPAPPSP